MICGAFPFGEPNGQPNANRTPTECRPGVQAWTMIGKRASRPSGPGVKGTVTSPADSTYTEGGDFLITILN